jgi:hypothetical protein
MPVPVTTPPVKRRLERSAERDKREYKNNFSAIYGEAISNRQYAARRAKRKRADGQIFQITTFR